MNILFCEFNLVIYDVGFNGDRDRCFIESMKILLADYTLTITPLSVCIQIKPLMPSDFIKENYDLNHNFYLILCSIILFNI